ncbi:MAG TPA: prepilin-type N-terminal cleavage/methylation domain-containing protein [Methylomirabilota bacterium]|nr:prepilin-type N-terminal cleavage/methylation domain-containing protein [Methylomirabilota bacterium]
MSLRRDEAGASLIEVMVSMLLLSVALLGLAVAFPQSRVAVQGGSQITVATNLGRRVLEEMRNVRYTATVDEITNGTFGPLAYGQIPDFPTFRRTVDIVDNQPEANCIPAPPTPCTKTVTVRVFFRDERGQEQSVDLRTIFVR